MKMNPSNIAIVKMMMMMKKKNIMLKNNILLMEKIIKVMIAKIKKKMMRTRTIYRQLINKIINHKAFLEKIILVPQYIKLIKNREVKKLKNIKNSIK